MNKFVLNHFRSLRVDQPSEIYSPKVANFVMPIDSPQMSTATRESPAKTLQSGRLPGLKIEQKPIEKIKLVRKARHK
jgi:hypothetical protein